MPDPTIIIGSLNDQELKSNIDALVRHVKEGTRTIATDFNATIEGMKNSLKSLGDARGAGSSSNSAMKKMQTDANQTKESYDQLATSIQKAVRIPSEMRMEAPKSARDSFYAFVEGMKQQERELKQLVRSWENLMLNRQIGRAEGVNSQIDATKTKINELKESITQLRKTQPDGYRDSIKERENEIERLKQKVIQLQAEYKRINEQNPFRGQAGQEYLTAAHARLAATQRAISEMTEKQQQSTTETKKQVQVQQQQAQVQQQQIASSKQYSEEILRQSQTIRENKQFQQEGMIVIGNSVVYAKSKLSIEEQLLQIQRSQTNELNRQSQAGQRYSDSVKQAADALRSQFMSGKSSYLNVGGQYIYRDSEHVSIEQQLNSLVASRTNEFNLQHAVSKAIEEDEKRIGAELEKQRQTISQQSQSRKVQSFSTYDDLRQAIAHVLGVQTQAVNLANAETDSYKKLSATLKQLKDTFDRLSASERSSEQGKALLASMKEVELAMRRIRSMQNAPTNLREVLGFTPQTIDEISYKLQQLNAYKRNINIVDPKQKEEIDKVDREINKLQKDLNKYMSTTQQTIGANNALTRSWNYMKNRLAFYFTVGASTQFVRNLIEVRSQYEMNERALGILINSAERGTQIFNELSQMALVSPYTLIELSSAAKQLTAYDIAARDVVDTTRRLADMASAVGVPIERLTYALGQIKAYGYLNSRDARMFANAGIPLVKQLSDYYTELEGKMVSTADIYDRIKKKAVGYEDVMQVVNRMTDDGGKFFDFQAKMADTLKVRLANLTLAWNNMLNEIGKETQGALTMTINGLKQLFLHWREFDKLIKEVAYGYGIAVALMLWNTAITRVYGSSGKLLKMFTMNAVFGKRFANVIRSIGASMKTLFATPMTWFMVASLWIFEVGNALANANEATKEFNKSLRESAKTTNDELTNFLNSDTNLSLRADLGKGDINTDEAKKAWETIREQIELSTRNSNEYIQSLLTIDNVSERLRQGYSVLESINTVNAALKDIDDTTIKITQDWSKWWNLWTLPDGLVENLSDYQNALTEINEEWGDLEKAKTLDAAADDVSKYTNALAALKKDVKTTTDSIDELIERLGWSADVNKINEVYAKVTGDLIEKNQLNPQLAFQLQLAVEESRSNAAKQALEIRIEDEKNALAKAADDNARMEVEKRIDALNQEYSEFEKNNGRGKVLWESFTTWMKERHVSEMREMFRGMSAEEISQIDFSTGKWNKFATETANKFAREHNLATNDAFTLLHNWVMNANKWSIFIPLTISTEGGKSVVDLLKEADDGANKAYQNIERLEKRLEQLRKAGGESMTSVWHKEYEKTKAEYEQEKKDFEDYTSLEKGGISTKEEKDAERARKEAEKASKKRSRDAEKAQKAAETELQKTLKDELSLIDKIRSSYKALTKEGATHADAIKGATSGYAQTVKNINSVFAKWGIASFDPAKFAGISNPRELVDLLQRQLDKLVASGRAKPAEIKDLQVKIQDLRLDAQKYDLKKITDGLNNELSKLKDEYELAVELDTNPELGNMFADILGIDLDDLPRTFGDAFERANKIARKKLSELNVFDPDFDLLSTRINKDENGNWMGLDFESDAVKSLTKWQDTFKDMFKKNITETEKMLDDYVKKYGDYSDKIAEIESDRLTKLHKLNEAYYTEEMRSRPDYIAKLNAIEQGAQREKGQATFDEFKNTRLYVDMFENLQFVSKATLETMRSKLKDLKREMGTLSPEQLKQVVQQFEKIDEELIRRNPFKGLIKNAKDYMKALGRQGKQAQVDFKTAQRKYDWELGTLTTMKEQLEQLKAEHPLNEERIKQLEDEITAQEQIVNKRREELEIAAELNEQYNLMRQLFGQQAQAIGKVLQVVASNLQSLAELRDTLKESFGVELGANIDATIDGLTKVGNGINQIVSSAQGGNVVGVVTGTVNTVAGIGDSIASIFGDGSARTKKFNKRIQESAEAVRRLNMAYKELEHAIEHSLGTAETQTRRLAIANKEAELAELEYQLQLEKRKRSKDRDEDSIHQYEESIQELKLEIEDLKEDLVNNLLGSDVKSAAEEFVDTWVDAWKAGETTLDAIQEKMDDMIMNLIKKAATSKIVARLLQPLYDAVDEYTKDKSEGGMELTQNEIRALAELSKGLGVDINEALGAYYGYLEQIGAVAKEGKTLSALQQGIQGITEDTAGALEAYANGISQQVYLHSDLLTQIRDAVIGFDLDVQVATMGQILLQLQASYQSQMAIQSMLSGWSNPSGQAVRVEMI